MATARTANGKRAENLEVAGRQITDRHKQRSEAAGWKQLSKAKKSAAKYDATMKEEEFKRLAKGVILEKRGDVFTEVSCDNRAALDLSNGRFLWFSINNINALVKRLQMEIAWCNDRDTYFLSEEGGTNTQLYFIRKDEEKLCIGLIKK